jgi:translation initiation factor 1A
LTHSISRIKRTTKIKMPNFQGGKKYKSSKQGESKADFHEIDDGQMVGRVIKILGNRNMLVFCNDGHERIAHIRGGLRKKNARIEIGDIILFSLRGDGMRIAGDSSGNTKERGDILAKYERETHHQLKKMAGINPRLFTNIETMDLRQRVAEPDDFGFTFDHDSESESEEEEGPTAESAEARAERKKASDKKRAAARSNKADGTAAKETASDGEVDIDAI